jgi:hypothetical protein
MLFLVVIVVTAFLMEITGTPGARLLVHFVADKVAATITFSGEPGGRTIFGRRVRQWYPMGYWSRTMPQKPATTLIQ